MLNLGITRGGDGSAAATCLRAPGLRWIGIASTLVACLIVLVGSAIADTLEPNGDALESRRLASGVPVSSNIANALDQDWFTFATGQTGTINIQLTSVPTNSDLLIDLYETDGFGQLTWLAQADDFGNGISETITGTASAGLYLVNVSGFQGAFDPVDTYTLTASFPSGWPGGGSDGNEPNDDPAIATPLSSGQPNAALISQPGDLDFYSITLAAPGPLGIQVTSIAPTADFDMRLYYRNGAGDFIFLANSVQKPGMDEAILLSDTGAAGTFYVLVYGFAGSFHTSDTYSIVASFTGGGGNEPPSISLGAPNGGESWLAGSVHSITWSASDPDATDTLTIDLAYSTNNGGSWTPIVAGLSNSGSYSWTIPETPTLQARVRATVSDGQASAEDASNGSFIISSEPAGENVLAVGNGAGASGTQVTVPLGLNNEDTVAGLQTDITFDAAVLAYVGGQSSERGAGLTYSASVVSQGLLRIVLYYESNTTLTAGQGTIADLTFSLIGSNGTSSAATPGSTVLSGPGGIPRNVTNQAGSISVEGAGAASPVVNLTAPNGGESWAAGSAQSILYSATDEDTPSNELSIRLEYSSNGGTSWSILADAQPNSGNFAWTVPGAATTAGRVRVTASDGERTGTDQSAANFSITALPPGENTLAVSSATGSIGGQVTLALTLDNEDEIGAIQTDVTFDPGIVGFSAAGLATRTGAMQVGASLVDANTLRLVVYSSSGNRIAAGQGAIADVTWNLLAAGASSLDLGASILSSPAGVALLVTEQDGSVTVTGSTTSNALSLGSATGTNGAGVSVALSIDNEDVVKRIEFEVGFDPLVAGFTGITAAGRGAGLATTSQILSAGRIGIALDSGAGTPLPIGNGQIASLAFTLVGENGTSTDLTISELAITNAGGQEVPATSSNGAIQVEEGSAAPVLHLSALKNPGRERTLQIFLSSDQALLSSPTVTAGTSAVAMTLLDAEHSIYVGSVTVGNGVGTVAVQAQGTSEGGTGQTSVNVAF